MWSNYHVSGAPYCCGQIISSTYITQHLFSIDMLSDKGVDQEAEENEKRKHDLKMEQN